MRYLFRQRVIAIGLATCALLAMSLVPGAATASTDGGSCGVEVTGPEVVCLECDERGVPKPPENQPLVVLKAEGIPSGGTYTWSVAEKEGGGKITWAQGTGAGVGSEALFVRGSAPSTQEGDVEVTVTYKVIVSETPCSVTQERHETVQKATELKVEKEMPFVVKNGQVQGDIPSDYQAAVNRVINYLRQRRPNDWQSYNGVILIRFYEVLDQFGKRHQCSGTLTEEVVPTPTLQGGTKVVNGKPDLPDHLFEFDTTTNWNNTRSRTVVQKITVYGNLVRYNKFVFTKDEVSRTEISKEEYERLKSELSCAGVR